MISAHRCVGFLGWALASLVLKSTLKCCTRLPSSPFLPTTVRSMFKNQTCNTCRMSSLIARYLVRNIVVFCHALDSLMVLSVRMCTTPRILGAYPVEYCDGVQLLAPARPRTTCTMLGGGGSAVYMVGREESRLVAYVDAYAWSAEISQTVGLA